MARRGPTTPPPVWKPPDEFDEYRLVAPLGKGGMGQVYLARDLFLDRTVAVKFLLDVRDSAATLERFRIEARAIARLQHPNVVVVHRIGEAAGYPYIVSEHIRGRSLAEVDKPVPWRRALDIGIGLARGLAAAHTRGVLHRDIKAANAMVDDAGGVKLLDFGLAKLGAGNDPIPQTSDPTLRDRVADPRSSSKQIQVTPRDAVAATLRVTSDTERGAELAATHADATLEATPPTPIDATLAATPVTPVDATAARADRRRTVDPKRARSSRMLRKS